LYYFHKKKTFLVGFLGGFFIANPETGRIGYQNSLASGIQTGRVVFALKNMFFSYLAAANAHSLSG
jgi:hypothetical protein